MNKIVKLLLLAVFFIGLIILPCSASDKIKAVAFIEQDFSLNDIPEEISFKLNDEIILNNRIIRKNSILTAETMAAQKERRWNKSGFILLNLKYYESSLGYKTDIKDKNIYLIARKYQKIKGKDIAITGTEIVLSQAASFFIPGIDILYYFTKGAIQRKNYSNFFKAGVSTAYENSLCRIWMKGRTIELDENDPISIKETNEKRAYKLKSQIEKRNMKQEKRNIKREKSTQAEITDEENELQ